MKTIAQVDGGRVTVVLRETSMGRHVYVVDPGARPYAGSRLVATSRAGVLALIDALKDVYERMADPPPATPHDSAGMCSNFGGFNGRSQYCTMSEGHAGPHHNHNYKVSWCGPVQANPPPARFDCAECQAQGNNQEHKDHVSTEGIHRTHCSDVTHNRSESTCWCHTCRLPIVPRR